MNALRLLPVAAGSVALIALGAAFINRKSRKSPDQKERERRTRISVGGRITDGTVIDVHEVEPTPEHPESQLVVYQYDVAGVSYECSQDVLVSSILTKLDYGQPIYQFAMLKPISLEGNEDKLDILYEEKVKVERAILDVYTAQRKKLLTQAAEDLKELHYELQTYVYACNI